MVNPEKKGSIILALYKIIDYRCEDIKKVGEFKKRHWSHYIGLGSLFQKISIITPKNQTVQPGDAFEGTAFKPEFENVKF
jgi:hypothetical protein